MPTMPTHPPLPSSSSCTPTDPSCALSVEAVTVNGTAQLYNVVYPKYGQAVLRIAGGSAYKDAQGG